MLLAAPQPPKTGLEQFHLLRNFKNGKQATISKAVVSQCSTEEIEVSITLNML
jgi:hypothetical protein